MFRGWSYPLDIQIVHWDETEDETKRVNSDIWRLGKTYFNRNPIVCEHALSSCQ